MSENMQPLYAGLVDELIHRIKTEWRADDKLPSERDLCEIYSLSRTTVRTAISHLEQKGYVYRERGRGTFVSGRKRKKENLYDYYSFTEHIKSLGKVPRTLVIDYKIIKSNFFISGQLGVEVGEKVIEFDRIRIADDIPMMVEKTVIPHGKFKEITRELLSSMPLYDIFEYNYNSEIYRTKEQFTASLIRSKEAELLGVEAADACLRITRHSYDENDEIIEFTRSTARSDMFVYTIDKKYK